MAKKTKAPVLYLVPRIEAERRQEQAPHDVAAGIAWLQMKADKGELRGLCYIALLGDSQYAADALGECMEERRVFSRGLLRELDDQLLKKQ